MKSIPMHIQLSMDSAGSMLIASGYLNSICYKIILVSTSKIGLKTNTYPNTFLKL